MATRKKRIASRRPKERGVALIIVIVSITLLTVVATEFAYNQRVDLQIAANHRDEIRAHYLAKSGIGMSRLLLSFQRQLDKQLASIPNLQGLLNQFMPGAGAADPGVGTPTPQPSSLNIQLWRLAKVDCHMLGGLVNQGPGDPRDEKDSPFGSSLEFDKEFPELAAAQANRNFGGFTGCFDAQISDEEERINVNSLTAGGLESRGPAQALFEMMSDKRFEFLFDNADANGVTVRPEDVIIAMHDWVDEDETQSALNLTPNTPDTFVQGFSDENSHYDRYTPRYKAKNARFDTLDELYRVHGVNDRFMAAFGDRLTVFPDKNVKLNVNTDDPLMMAVNVMLVADPIARDPRLTDPIFMAEVIDRIRTARMFSFFGMSVADFVAIVESMGIRVNSLIKTNPKDNKFVSDKSSTYRIVSVGEAGAVQKTITTVVRLDDGLGRLVYWREE